MRMHEEDWVGNGTISSEDYARLINSDAKISEGYLICFSSICRDIYLSDNMLGDRIHTCCQEADKLYNECLVKIGKEYEVRISSFSNFDEKHLNTYMEMWGHYASSHEGFCVEYDTKKMVGDEFLNDVICGGLLPCIYSSKPQRIAESLLFKYALGKKMTPKQRVDFEKSIINSYISKSSSWSYEQEWRLLVPGDYCEAYGDMIDFFPIKKIYAGCKMSTDNLDYLVDFADRKGCKISQMRILDSEYRLEEGSINPQNYFEEKAFFSEVSARKKGLKTNRSLY